MEKEFCLETYLKEQRNNDEKEFAHNEDGFLALCSAVRREFDKEWENADDDMKNRRLQREKGAIIGYEQETGYYKERINEILIEKNWELGWYPDWYPNIVEGIFAELYGLAGLAPWAYDMKPEYKNSSSAKLIGDKLYCLIDGVSKLQPQRISKKRRIQLKRALLLSTPKEREEYGFHEIYLHNGIRITIFSGDRTKENQDVMVFRKYVLEELSFGSLVDLGTIPVQAIRLFTKMIEIGVNVIFAGPVRSGKTTFLQTWQKYEDKTLEGVAIATDPETPWDRIMPNAPIMQLVADGFQLENMMKSLLRGDNDYVLLEEMRDAVAFNLAIEITSTGTKRSKATIHDGNALNIPFKMATKIREKYGGDANPIIAQIFQNFDYIFEFRQVEQLRSRKILKGITKLHYDLKNDQVFAIKICQYSKDENKWLWNSDILEDSEVSHILEELASENRLSGDVCISPSYYESRNSYE